MFAGDNPVARLAKHLKEQLNIVDMADANVTARLQRSFADALHVISTFPSRKIVKYKELYSGKFTTLNRAIALDPNMIAGKKHEKRMIAIILLYLEGLTSADLQALYHCLIREPYATSLSNLLQFFKDINGPLQLELKVLVRARPDEAEEEDETQAELAALVGYTAERRRREQGGERKRQRTILDQYPDNLRNFIVDVWNDSSVLLAGRIPEITHIESFHAKLMKVVKATVEVYKPELPTDKFHAAAIEKLSEFGEPQAVMQVFISVSTALCNLTRSKDIILRREIATSLADSDWQRFFIGPAQASKYIDKEKTRRPLVQAFLIHISNKLEDLKTLNDLADGDKKALTSFVEVETALQKRFRREPLSDREAVIVITAINYIAAADDAVDLLGEAESYSPDLYNFILNFKLITGRELHVPTPLTHNHRH